MTEETAIKKQIKQYLDYTGWFSFHVLQGLGSFHGVPDKIAIKNGIVLFIEIKSSTGRQSGHQKRFQELIENHGGYYLLARSVEDVDRYISNLTGQGSLMFV